MSVVLQPAAHADAQAHYRDTIVRPVLFLGSCGCVVTTSRSFDDYIPAVGLRCGESHPVNWGLTSRSMSVYSLATLSYSRAIECSSLPARSRTSSATKPRPSIRGRMMSTE